mgnify:CR=1 FL=1
MGAIIGQFKMTLLPKGAENRKNEENRLKIDKILLFLPFAQKWQWGFVQDFSVNSCNYRIGIYANITKKFDKSCIEYYNIGRVIESSSESDD